jgi:glucan phosphoethanolaminetransferase (alkaline phosphatase superfamily)
MQFHSSACPRGVKALLCCAAVLALGSLAGCKRSQSSANPPASTLLPLNLVVVTIDTLRPDHLHCYGYPKIETPTLDAIAQAGVLFEK